MARPTAPGSDHDDGLTEEARGRQEFPGYGQDGPPQPGRSPDRDHTAVPTLLARERPADPTPPIAPAFGSLDGHLRAEAPHVRPPRAN
jgi:hypothetical protein